MSWANFHTHCHFCDGKGKPQEYVEEALRQGVKTLGFSSHAPLPFSTNWTMPPERLEEYCRTIHSLQKKYEGKIELFLGLEIDFIPEVTGPGAPQFRSLGLDYIIGAVHFFDVTLKGERLTIDDTLPEFSKAITGIYTGDARKAVESHYQLIRAMVEEQCPDVVAHLDLIKKNNKGEQFFSEHEAWYRTAVFDTLETIAASGAILEVNTGGIARKRSDSLYPSAWILERVHELKMPITLNSDAHKTAQLTGGFKEAAEVLQDLGFTQLQVLTSEGWKPVRFSPAGIADQ